MTQTIDQTTHKITVKTESDIINAHELTFGPKNYFKRSPLPATIPIMVVGCAILSTGLKETLWGMYTLLSLLIVFVLIFMIQQTIADRKESKKERQFEEDYLIPYLNNTKLTKYYLMTPDMLPIAEERLGKFDEDENGDHIYTYYYEEDTDPVYNPSGEPTLRFLFTEHIVFRGEVKVETTTEDREYITAIELDNNYTEKYPSGLYNVTKYVKA